MTRPAPACTPTDVGEISARRVVLALPQNILGDLAIEPQLTRPDLPPVASVLSRGQVLDPRARTSRSWATRLAAHPFSVVRTEYVGDDDAVLVSFGADCSRLDLNDNDAIRCALTAWRDDLEVLEITKHDCMNDPAFGGDLAHPPATTAHVNPAGLSMTHGSTAPLRRTLRSILERTRAIVGS